MLPFRSKKYQEKMCKPALETEEAASQWILRREQLPEYRVALELLSHEEKTAIFWRDWDDLDELAQRDLVRATYSDSWYELIAGYPNLSYNGRLQVLEALGYIHNAHVVDFLVSEMKREDETIRMSAANALKHQDPVLTIEPMLEALARPEVFLASRIFDVLRAIGPKLVPVIMQMIEQADGQGRIVMAQLLGAFGDESVLPVLDKLAASEDYTLRKVAVEAMAEIGTSAILPAMARALDDGSWQLRLVAVEAIGRHELTDGVPLLQSALLKENDPLVKEMMSETIHQLDRSQAPITYLWRRQGKEAEQRNGKYRSKRYSRDYADDPYPEPADLTGDLG